VAGDWRRLHNEDLHYLCVTPDIIWEIKSRKIILAVHEARMGAMRTALVSKLEGRTLH